MELNQWQNFTDAARRYCALIAANDTCQPRPLLADLLHVLLALYGQALDLPAVEPPANHSDRSISHDEWQRIYNRLSATLGEYDGYWLVTEPFSPEGESAVCTTLSDDLADIYRDLQDGLLNLELGVPKASIYWEWRFSFQTHWGRHAVSATNAIHSMLFGPHSGRAK